MVGRTLSSRVLVAGLVTGVVAGLTACSAVPPAQVSSPPASAEPTAAPSVSSPPPTPSPTPTPPPMPDGTALASELAEVSRAGIKDTGVVVVDPATGTTLTSRGDEPLVPASTMKVITTLAAVDTLGARATFSTTVVAPEAGRLILVGGGDPMLTDKQSDSKSRVGSLESLAEQTVATLKQSKTTSVRLGYDASLFAGPGWHPSWKSSWRSYTALVGALTINGARSGQWTVHKDPARTAAEAFAARLKQAGIKVTAVKAEQAKPSATVVAEVRSAPLWAIVGHTLRNSDNFVAEVLSRQVALRAGGDGSFKAGATAVRTWLKTHGLWAEGMVIDDGSGLSKKSRVRPSILAKALSLVLTTPSLSAVANGLPVAGVNGTLKDRFDDKSEKAGRKVVHAKTGTLLGVASLAGYVTTRDGATLAFALMANQATGRDTAYNWLDRTASVLAGCGCRGTD